MNGRTGGYLKPAAGRADWSVFAMASEGLGSTLSIAFREAVENGKIVSVQAPVIDDDTE